MAEAAAATPAQVPFLQPITRDEACQILESSEYTVFLFCGELNAADRVYQIIRERAAKETSGDPFAAPQVQAATSAPTPTADLRARIGAGPHRQPRP